MFGPDITPDSPPEKQPAIGIIGMGAMGAMYAKCLSKGGWKRCARSESVSSRLIQTGFRRIYVCDQPSKYEEIKAKYDGRLSNVLLGFLRD